MFFRLGVGLLGPLAALLVTWLPPLGVTRLGMGMLPTHGQIERLRQIPSDARLSELRSFAVAAETFRELDAPQTVRAANDVLDGHFNSIGLIHWVTVPFKADPEVLGTSYWNLELCSLIVPNLLSRAYAVSGDIRFLDAAVRYVLDWSEFESTLWLPRGYVFSDHAVSARAIVVTEVWRLYRNSQSYEPVAAAALLTYVHKLGTLLRAPRLYEYRTNHGLMQSLALLHLAVAFPLLADAEVNKRIGAERFLAQVPYFINKEGVVLEHSPGYHHNGLSRVAAGMQYLSLLNIQVPPDLIERYQRGLSFDATLFRPDGTLPPIGDTGDGPFDLRDVTAREYSPRPWAPAGSVAVMPAGGFAVLWGNLDQWPNAAALSQAVMNWGNFPTKVHKHADDLGLTLWAGGFQWVRPVGGWPFDATRALATGWRSSNAPHWLDEDAAVERTTALLSSVRADQTNFLDVVRVNSDGASARRQLLQISDRTWATIDSLESTTPRKAEIIWRFSPGATLRSLESGECVVEMAGAPIKMTVSFDGNVAWTPEADELGTAAWNSGVATASGILRSPAIRLTATDTTSALLSVFELGETAGADHGATAAGLQWRGPEQWLTSFTTAETGRTTISRAGVRLSVVSSGSSQETRTVSSEIEHAVWADRLARAAFDEMSRKYGSTFRPMLERRVKVTWVVLATGLGQVILFLFLTRRDWWRSVLLTSSVAWLALAAFLRFDFLA